MGRCTGLLKLPLQRHHRHPEQSANSDCWDFASPRCLVGGVAAKVKVFPSCFRDGDRLAFAHHDTFRSGWCRTLPRRPGTCYGKNVYPAHVRHKGEAMVVASNVEFTSYVDEKYKTVPRRKLDKDEDVLSSPIRSDDVDRIVGLGGRQKVVHLRQYPDLFSKFADVKTPEDLLAFVTEYGRLTSGRKGDDVQPLLRQAKSMRACLRPRHPRIRPSMSMTNLRAWLATDKAKGTVSVKIAPKTLLDALWLQLGQSLAGGTEWKECRGCGTWFPVGGTSGKRSVAAFCSDKCRIKFNSLERSR